MADLVISTTGAAQPIVHRNELRSARTAHHARAVLILDLAESVHRVSGPTIRRLRSQADAIKQEELARLLAKLDARDVEPEVRKEIELAFDRLVNKLLHPPLKSLRDHADTKHHANLLDALRHLFQLKD